MGLWLTEAQIGALTGGDWEPGPSVFQSPSTERKRAGNPDHHSGKRDLPLWGVKPFLPLPSFQGDPAQVHRAVGRAVSALGLRAPEADRQPDQRLPAARVRRAGLADSETTFDVDVRG